jgi:hypothetical protein
MRYVLRDARRQPHHDRRSVAVDGYPSRFFRCLQFVRHITVLDDLYLDSPWLVYFTVWQSVRGLNALWYLGWGLAFAGMILVSTYAGRADRTGDRGEAGDESERTATGFRAVCNLRLTV